MANSLSIQGTVQFQVPASNQNFNELFNLQSTSVPAGSSMNKQIFVANATPSLVTLDGVATPGVVFLRNLDNTNTVTYGINTTAQNALIKPNQIAIWQPNGTTLSAGTVSGTASLQIFATPV